MPTVILIVEDDMDLARPLKELLQAEGYQVELAWSGRAALTLLKAAVHLPQLILLDLLMPDLDGFQFCAARAVDPRLAAVPVIITTAADMQTVHALKRLHPDVTVVHKPFDVDKLLDAVKHAVQ